MRAGSTNCTREVVISLEVKNWWPFMGCHSITKQGPPVSIFVTASFLIYGWSLLANFVTSWPMPTFTSWMIWSTSIDMASALGSRSCRFFLRYIWVKKWINIFILKDNSLLQAKCSWINELLKKEEPWVIPKWMSDI